MTCLSMGVLKRNDAMTCLLVDGLSTSRRIVGGTAGFQ